MLPGYDAAGQRMDDGSLLLYPELVLKGWLPYRDFETFYGPGNAYLLAAVYGLFHPGIFLARTVGFAYHLAILAAVFFIVRRRGIALASGVVLIAHCFLLLTGLAPFAWVGGLAFALWSIFLGAAQPGERQMFCAGFLGGVALLFRPDLAPALCMAAGLLLFFARNKLRLSYVLGLGVGVLPMLLLLYGAGFRNIFDNLVLYPVVVTNPARKLPWQSLPLYLKYLVSLHLAASAANLGAGMLALRKDSAAWSNQLFAAAAIFSTGITHETLQRMDRGHVTLCCFLSLALLPAALMIIAERVVSRPSSQSRPLLCVTATLLLVLGLAPELAHLMPQAAGWGTSTKEVVFLEHNARSFPLGGIEAARETGALLDKITRVATPGERLFVGPADLRRTNYNDTFLYHLLPQLTPATYFLELNSLSANRPGSRLSTDVLSADWLILDHRLDEWNEPNKSMRFGSDEPNVVVQSHFEMVARSGSYDLYRKKSTDAASPP